MSGRKIGGSGDAMGRLDPPVRGKPTESRMPTVGTSGTERSGTVARAMIDNMLLGPTPAGSIRTPAADWREMLHPQTGSPGSPAANWRGMLPPPPPQRPTGPPGPHGVLPAPAGPGASDGRMDRTLRSPGPTGDAGTRAPLRDTPAPAAGATAPALGQRARALRVAQESPEGSTGRAVAYYLEPAIRFSGEFASGTIGDDYERNRHLLDAPANPESNRALAEWETARFRQMSGMARIVGGAFPARARAALLNRAPPSRPK
jgi:hypothetical protein